MALTWHVTRLLSFTNDVSVTWHVTRLLSSTNDMSVTWHVTRLLSFTNDVLVTWHVTRLLSFTTASLARCCRSFLLIHPEPVYARMRMRLCAAHPHKCPINAPLLMLRNFLLQSMFREMFHLKTMGA